jgi:hypothetical protein
MEFRTIDGSGNSLFTSDLNAAGTAFTRIGPANFADGIAAPIDGPNPRVISNTVVGEGEADAPNAQGLSGMMYAWGQFIDHDLDLIPTDGVTHMDMTVPDGDPAFSAGTVIPMTRAVIDPRSGTDPDHPAIAIDAITGWLDASMVYGSDPKTAASLRLADGHLKTSGDDYLPIVDGVYVSGDARAGENPSLTALQTLFMREHNYQVDRLHHEHPGLTGDQLYEQARAIVAAEIAHVTYAEFLPHLLGPHAISDYRGYDSTVDPRISVEFAGAAYRFGHSIVSGETEKLGEDGQVLEEARDLKDVFFEDPSDFTANSGADGILRHLAADLSQSMDARIVDDLRNSLIDPPVGQDLASLNIERGRDLGLGRLNETREALGLEKYTSFDQITGDKATVAALEKAFANVDEIDLWTGGLSEKLAPGAFIGPTFQTIIADQFERLRDGDRLWFENQGFDAPTLTMIEHSTLADIVRRNTDTQHIQDDVFVFADRHSGESGANPAEHTDAPQLVIGTEGKDTLLGGAFDDILVAAPGHQLMTGGGGDDDFVLSAARTHAKIADFDPGHDTVTFEYGRGLSFEDLGFRLVDENTVVHAGGTSVVLVGVRPDQLGSSDFAFA